MRIIIPTDFSFNAELASRYAITLFGVKDVEYHLLNTFKLPRAGAGMLVSIEGILNEESRMGLKAASDKLRRFGGPNTNVFLHSEKGEVHEITDRLRKLEMADLVVMGTQGSGGIEEKLIGSKTWQVLNELECPIMIVPNHVELREPKNIGFSTDLDRYQPKDVKLLSKLIHSFSAQLYLVTVDHDEMVHAVEDHQDLSELNGDRVILEQGEVTERLNEFCNEYDIDLLIMIRRQHGFFDRIFGQSATRKMAMHSKVPLLVMKDSGV